MARIKVTRSGPEYTGRTVGSIVRRVWGRTAWFKPEAGNEDFGQVLKPYGDGSNVEATIVVHEW